MSKHFSLSNKQLTASTSLRFIIVFFSLLLLSACQSNSPISDNQQTYQDAENLLNQAKNSYSPQREAYQIEAAQVLTNNGKVKNAMDVLALINPEQLPVGLLTDYSLLYSKLALDDDAFFLTKRILSHKTLEQQWAFIPLEAQKTLLKRRAALFSLLAQPMKGLEDFIHLQTLEALPEDKLALQDDIWQTLLTIPHQELQPLSNSSQNPTIKGWLDLAYAVRNNQTDIEQQLSAVHQWIALWPSHPASLNLPQDVMLLEQIVANRPQTIAIFLPNQGKLNKAAKAIREGLLAAHFSAKKQGLFTPTLRFIDSSNSDIDTLYARAITLQAEWVIGPLDKRLIAQLSQMENLPLPTLALNYDKLGIEPPTQLFQFGLAVEDEAQQITQQAWLEGFRQAAIITPDSSWGARAQQTFTDSWKTLGGTATAQANFKSSDYSQATEKLLHVNSSKTRARLLRQTSGLKLEAETRRRQDIDAIFMAASPQEGRQLKPTFAFHDAADIPVYSTSRIYTGVQDKRMDRDLNKVRFTALPWFFDQQHPAKRTLLQAAPAKIGYGTLYALGIDAYQLYPRLPQLASRTSTTHFCLSGSLQLNDQQHIIRHSQWAYFKAGTARPLPMLSQSQ